MSWVLWDPTNDGGMIEALCGAAQTHGTRHSLGFIGIGVVESGSRPMYFGLDQRSRQGVGALAESRPEHESGGTACCCAFPGSVVEARTQTRQCRPHNQEFPKPL